MRKLFFIIAICMGAITVQGKDRFEKTVPVTQFDKVSLTAGFIVNYTQGVNHECTIFASPKDMEHINIDNVDSTCQKTVLSVAGAGEISASFTDCDELKCSIAGAGEIELNGKVANYSESIAGSGWIKKDKLLITGESR